MASGDLSIKAGSYDVDATSWFDIRYSDQGVAVSLCDNDTNVRYTVVISNGKAVFAEVDDLIRHPNTPRTDGHGDGDFDE